MKSLVLRLEGPLQAWATQSKLAIRDTDREPSKSGVLGILAAALGVDRQDDEGLARLRPLSMAVRVDRPGSLLRDFHTAGGGRFRGSSKYFVHGVSDCVPTTRYYLQDACFTVALSGPDALLEKAAAAVQSPVWPLFLGRRSCPPSTRPFLGVVEGPAASVIRQAFLIPREERRNPEPRLRLVIEARPEEGEPRYDVPLSFQLGAREYGLRYVRTEWLELEESEQPKAAEQEVSP